jgi:GT2 family glycosyltransferase
VLAQTCEDFEVLVIDDGSDGTEQALADLDPRVKYVRGSAEGVATARNAGIDKTTGDFVAFLDDDDWWYPRKLECLLDAFRLHPDAGLIYSGLNCVDRHGATLWPANIRGVHGDGYAAVLEGNFIANSAAVVRRACLTSVGRFDGSLSGCEDWDFWIRLARQYPMYLVPEVLVAYEYLSEGRVTSRHLVWLQAIDEVLTKALAADPDLPERRRRRIRSGIAWSKGRVCLRAGDDELALKHFLEALRLRATNWHALVYVGVLSVPFLRSVLPRRIKLALRLPEAHLTSKRSP